MSGSLHRLPRAWLSIVLLLAAAGADAGDTLRVSAAQLESRLPVEQVRAEAAAFRPVETASLPLRVEPGTRQWLRIDRERVDAREVLVLDRVPLRSLEVWQLPSGGEPAPVMRDSWLSPPPGDALRSSYLIPLGEARIVLVALDPVFPVQVQWALREERMAEREARAVSNLSAATYAALLAAALVSLALTLAVRQPAYRDFTVFAFLWGSFLALTHGHAYELPGVGGWLGALGPGLLLLGGSLCAASAIAVANGLLGLSEQARPLARAAKLLSASVAGAGVLLVLLPPGRLAAWAPGWGLAMLTVLALPVLAAAWRWRCGARPAAAQCALWLVFWIAAAAQLGVTTGWLPGSDLLRALQQLGSLSAVLGLSIALTDRVIALRQHAETLQVMHANSSAVLRVEQKRRELSEALERDAALAAEPSDLEWRAFRQLLQALPEVLTVRSVALTVTGYRGFDYLLVEPMSDKPRVCALLAERTSTLKGICRSRNAMALPADPSERRPPQRAVVPLPVGRPGWGALLLERSGDNGFSADELELAAEFVALTFKAIEQGARAVELRRRAESDPLTGVIHHRAGSERLEALMRAARLEDQPLGVLFIDADLLRIVNERFGMSVGDHFLRSLGGVLQPLLRDQDLLYRHGGDEFVLALPGLSLEEAEQVGERVRAAVAAQRFRSDDGPIKITVSIGVAALQPGDESVQRLVERGARAAELAKGQGRNQVARPRAFGAQADAPDRPPIF